MSKTFSAEDRARFSALMRANMARPEYRARIAAVREGKAAFTLEQQAAMITGAEAKQPIAAIAAQIGISRRRVAKWLQARELKRPATRADALAAGAAVLRRLYETQANTAEMIVEYRAAAGAHRSINDMRCHARRLGLRRPDVLRVARIRTAVDEIAERRRQQRDERAAAIQALLDGGATLRGACRQLGFSRSTQRNLWARGLLVVPPRPKRERKPKAPRVAKPKPAPKPKVYKPKQYAKERPKPERRISGGFLIGAQDVRGSRLDATADVAAWIAAHGVTRCPAAFVAASTAAVSAEEAAAIRAHNDRRAEADKGSWKQRVWQGMRRA